MIRVQINPEYDSLREFINKIPDIFDNQGEMLHDGRNVIKLFRTENGTLLNVKRYHVPSGPNLLVYSLGIRKPKGQRAFEYPRLLISRGIETPAAVAYIEERRHQLLGYSYFISIQCTYGHTMYELGNAREGTYEQIAAEFARFTAHLHESGIMHMDYSPGNILYTRSSDGSYKFSLVDINRMYFGTVGRKKGLANFTRLWGPKRFFILMIREYARLRGFDEEESVEFALGERRKFWTRYRKKHNVDFRLEL